ncbi:unnamed protein product, partial [Brassica oleracea]
KNLLALVVLLALVGVSVAKPYGNPLRNQNRHKDPWAMGDLDLDYYRSTCPQLESIVRRVTFQYVSLYRTFAAALLRMYFHDCFVRGCADGSILRNHQTRMRKETLSQTCQ